MSNKMALDALTAALEAMESCEEGDYSTGHVCHPSFDSDAIDAAIEQARAAIAALQAGPQPEADMFWDGDDPESFGHDIQDLVAERDVGDVLTVDCAMRLPSFKVRVIAGETEQDDKTWEEVLPAAPPKD